MFLRRITLTGFKSFASKTVLDLEPGITGVVGPNGSGKSNLADAVRWALGEQSKGRLRLTDREEVVFAGTAKRAKASFAEVVLLFDNQDGAFPIDLTEVEISRRLYRSGEADYRLAGRSVRLGDIQALLAEAGFGANTYAVIGQGMIDSFLLSSPAERKLLFDEAAGIRAPELSRESALRKLAATEANLTRLRDIATELSPRLASLERAVADAAEQEALERRVAQLRAAVVAAGLAQWQARQRAAADRLQVVAATAHRLRHDQSETQRKLEAAVAKEAGLSAERERLQLSLAALESQRDELGMKLTDAHNAVAEIERGREQAEGLERQLKTARTGLGHAQAKEIELEAELASNAEAAARALKAVERASRDVAAAQSALVAISKSTDDGTRDQYVDHALQIIRTLAVSLGGKTVSMDEVRLLIHKAGRLLSHATRTGAAELLAGISSAQKQLETAMGKRETAVEHQTNITITRRSLEIDLAHQREAARRAGEQVAALAAGLEAAQTAAASLPEAQQHAAQAAVALTAATQRLEGRRREVRALSATPGDTFAHAHLAAALERAKAAAVAAGLEQTQLKATVAEAEAGLASVHAQAKAWGIANPAPASGGQPPDELSRQLIQAEALVEARAQTRLGQITEYEEVSARSQELNTQIADLQSAGRDLERIVAELDELIRTRFKENFQALAEQFSVYFTRLFDGGTASLELEETEGGAYGIIIKASPKGKRLVSLTALSGGERALAGVALLAAILRVNPSPFVVLDEIDAALDEANSGRLATILAELGEHSQLIVITHNRQTMQAARVLYGVTINDQHVSHLLSMRLEAATALAAR